MTHSDYTKNILNIKDENIFFDENCLKICKINNIDTKIFHGYLSYTQKYCDVCGCINESSNDTELSIKLELMNKIYEKDISKHFNVSHNKINRIMHELSRKTVLPGSLPTIMNFDEFKATKDTEGKMAFIITNNETGKTFDILLSRKSNYLRKYFFRFPRNQRLKVKFNNWIIEGTNNLIKCIKRIAFGYKSFYHFKTRILLITGIYKIA